MYFVGWNEYGTAYGKLVFRISDTDQSFAFIDINQLKITVKMGYVI
jgi:hypothetical protein